MHSAKALSVILSGLLAIASTDSATIVQDKAPPHVAAPQDSNQAAAKALRRAVTHELLAHGQNYGMSKRQAYVAARVLCQEAKRAQVDPLLVVALIGVESSFNPRAVSHVGAQGLMQLMPTTASYEAGRMKLLWHAADAFEPSLNVRLGIHYLAWLRKSFHGRIDWALTAYNRGPHATHHIAALNRAVPREIYRAYAGRVMKAYAVLSKHYALMAVKRA